MPHNQSVYAGISVGMVCLTGVGFIRRGVIAIIASLSCLDDGLHGFTVLV